MSLSPSQPAQEFRDSITIHYNHMLKSPELLREILEDKGIAIVTEVLSPAETGEALSLVWDYLESLGTAIKRDDLSTHGNDRWIPSTASGVSAHPHTGQSTAMWYARGHEGVQQCFRVAYGEQGKLITSFDTMVLYRNPDYDGKYSTKCSLYHCQKDNLTQGYVNLIDTTAATEGGLIVVPGSHKLIALHQQESVDCSSLEQQGKTRERIGAPAGSLVLFKSMLLRSYAPCKRRKTADLSQSLRGAMLLVCMEPFSHYNDEQYLWRTERANAISLGLTTYHMPQELRSRQRPKLSHRNLVDLDELQRLGTVLHSPTQLTDRQRAVL